jgi:hypothetical protein
VAKVRFSRVVEAVEKEKRTLLSVLKAVEVVAVYWT